MPTDVLKKVARMFSRIVTIIIPRNAETYDFTKCQQLYFFLKKLAIIKF